MVQREVRLLTRPLVILFRPYLGGLEMLTEGRMPPRELAAWLKESMNKLRMIRDAVKPYAIGNTADSLLDAATVMALADPLASAMMRLSKRIQGDLKGKSRGKAKAGA